MLYNYEPLYREVIRATHREGPRTAARFRPFGLETERESLPSELPKSGRDLTSGLTALAIDPNAGRALTSIHAALAAVRSRLATARGVACVDCACC